MVGKAEEKERQRVTVGRSIILASVGFAAEGVFSGDVDEVLAGLYT